MAAAALESVGLFQFNKLRLTGSPKNRDATANFGFSWN